MSMTALGSAFSPLRAAEVIEVHAVDGYLLDQAGNRIGREHVGHRLRVTNVEEVQGLDLALAAIDVISVHGEEQRVLQLEELASNGDDKGSNICKQRGDGSTWLVPVAGRWTAQGELHRDVNGATLACASGAVGKCVEWGFTPWGDVGQFTACTRMARADYCGDGQPHTLPGVRIAFERVHDGAPLPATPAGFHFEALWGADGAHCVRAMRVPELFSIDDLLKQCPDRVAGSSTSSHCEGASNSPGSTALLANFLWGSR